MGADSSILFYKCTRHDEKAVPLKLSLNNILLLLQTLESYYYVTKIPLS